MFHLEVASGSAARTRSLCHAAFLIFFTVGAAMVSTAAGAQSQTQSARSEYLLNAG